jgi:GNAT superfamily N-acetyltransferase
VDGIPVGHGQWHVVSEGTADVALAVVDTWHRRGVATALLDHLAATAHDAGLERFACWVHPENAPVREMLLSRDARHDAVTGAWVLDIAAMCAHVPSSHEAAA